MTPTRTEAVPSAVSSAVDLSQMIVTQEMAGQNAKRSLLAQLLHALNQPLTGLQCSMEVALASPHTIEQYVQGLQDGLKLTERMRALVGAIQEVTEIEKASDLETAKLDAVELESVLLEVVEELRPVAEGKNVRIALGRSSASSSLSSPPLTSSSSLSSSSLAGRRERSELAPVIFRLLDSTLSMVACGTTLRVETSSKTNQAWLRVNWHAESPASAYSLPELGLIIVQAWVERAGAEWQREETDGVETLTVRLPSGRNA